VAPGNHSSLLGSHGQYGIEELDEEDVHGSEKLPSDLGYSYVLTSGDDEENQQFLMTTNTAAADAQTAGHLTQDVMHQMQQYYNQAQTSS